MIYQPAEDSFLIQKEVQRLAKGRVLDMGVGSGIQAETAAKQKKVKSVLGVDIKKAAIGHCKETVKSKKAKFMISDLFTKVPKQKFDTVIFNPPYLPEQEGELWELQTDVAGGRHGYEIIGRFMADVNDYLDANGAILLLFSTITGRMAVERIIEEAMMDFEPLNKLSIAFEQLHVYKITKSAFRKQLEKRGLAKISFFARGHRGFIFTGMLNKKKIAIKTQRKDIDATGTVDNEVQQLRLLNKHGIGPKILFSGKDYFAYQFVEGEFILDWMGRKDVKKQDVIAVFKNVFEQMYTLDNLGLNKEEMHHPVKHIVVQKNRKPVLLDFERCKARPQSHNVTQFAQFIISGRLLNHLKPFNMKINMLDMMKHTRIYKQRKTRENFESIVALLK